MWFMSDKTDKDAVPSIGLENRVMPQQVRRLAQHALVKRHACDAHAQQVSEMHGANCQDSCYSAVAGASGAELLVVDIAGCRLRQS